MQTLCLLLTERDKTFCSKLKRGQAEACLEPGRGSPRGGLPVELAAGTSLVLLFLWVGITGVVMFTV